MNRYKVWSSNNHSILVKAKTARRARAMAWDSIKDGFTYGWERADFLSNATTEKLN